MSPTSALTAIGGSSSPPLVTSPPVPSPAGTSTSVPDQVVSVLSPLVSSGDGFHTVTLGLHPEGLGTVEATVSLDGGQVLVSLWAASENGHAALAQALPQLHQQLSAGADHAVSVALAPFGSHTSGDLGARHGAPPSPTLHARGSGETPDSEERQVATSLPHRHSHRAVTVDLRL